MTDKGVSSGLGMGKHETEEPLAHGALGAGVGGYGEMRKEILKNALKIQTWNTQC